MSKFSKYRQNFFENKPLIRPNKKGLNQYPSSLETLETTLGNKQLLLVNKPSQKRISQSSSTKYPLFLLTLILLVSFVILFKTDLQIFVSEIRYSYHLWRAKSYLDLNNINDAYKELSAATAILPKKIEAWAKLFEISPEQSSEQHLRALSNLAILDQNSSKYALEFLSKSLQTRNFYIATPLLSQILDTHPHDVELIYKISLILTHIGLYNAAYELLVEARKLAPQNSKLLLAQSTLELLSLDSGVLANAVANLETIRLTNPEFSQAATLNLISYYLKNNQKKALTLLQEALKNNPNSWELRLLELDLGYQTGEEDLASLFEQVAELANTHERLTELLSRVAKYQNPNAAFRLLSGIPKELLSAEELTLARFQILWISEDYQQIIEQATNHPASVDLRKNILITLWKIRALNQTQPTAARDLLEKTVTSLISRPTFLLECVEIFQSWELHEYSAVILERLANSKGPYAYHALILLYEHAHKRGDIASLFRITDSLLQIQPENPVLLFNYAALALELAINLPRAERISEALYKSNPEDAGLAHLYAQALAANGKHTEALAVYDSLPAEAIRTAPILQPYEALILNKMQKTTDSSF